MFRSFPFFQPHSPKSACAQYSAVGSESSIDLPKTPPLSFLIHQTLAVTFEPLTMRTYIGLLCTTPNTTPLNLEVSDDQNVTKATCWCAELVGSLAAELGHPEKFHLRETCELGSFTVFLQFFFSCWDDDQRNLVWLFAPSQKQLQNLSAH